MKKIRVGAEDFEFNARGERCLWTRDVAKHAGKLTQQARIVLALLQAAKDGQVVHPGLF